LLRRALVKTFLLFLALASRSQSATGALCKLTHYIVSDILVYFATYFTATFNLPATLMRNESVPIRLAQCRFRGLAISNAKI